MAVIKNADLNGLRLLGGVIAVYRSREKRRRLRISAVTRATWHPFVDNFC
jgi:hypothetical protein